MIKNYNKVILQMKGIKFYKLSYLKDISECFYTPSTYLNENISYRNILADIGNIGCINNYSVKKSGKKKILLLLSATCVNRIDNQKKFNNIEELINDKIVVKPNFYTRYNNYGNIPIILIWLLQMKKVKCSLKVKLLYCIELYKTFLNYSLIKNVIDENRGFLTLIFTYTDTHMIDCLVSKYGNYLGIDTVTLQHGAHNTNKKIFGKDNDTSWSFTKSCSKYMLIFGPHILHFCKMMRIQKGKMIATGCAQDINSIKINNINFNKKGVFGIFLDGLSEGCTSQSDNNKLLSYCDKIADKYSIKYIIRKHPFDKSFYKYNKNNCLRISNEKENIEVLSKDIDFCIMSNTTVFYQTAYFLILTFRFIYSDYDPYSEINWNKFYDLNGLMQLMNKYYFDDTLCNKMVIKTRNWLYADGDVRENFKKFFDKFC